MTPSYIAEHKNNKTFSFQLSTQPQRNNYLAFCLVYSALGLETQIHIKTPSSDGLTVECKSGGWFPQPQMEWRDNNGEVVPPSSKSYSQDGAKLFHIEMTLLLRNRSQGNMTCYIRNPLIGEGKQTNIIIVGEYSAGVQLSIK